jgi:hypothetical protein
VEGWSQVERRLSECTGSGEALLGPGNMPYLSKVKAFALYDEWSRLNGVNVAAFMHRNLSVIK